MVPATWKSGLKVLLCVPWVRGVEVEVVGRVEESLWLERS